MTNFCATCGTSVDSTALYCSRCGAALTENANVATDWENPFAPPRDAPGAAIVVADDASAPNIPGFFGAFFLCLKKYGDFRGRASRSEFWYFQLSSALFVLFICGGVGAFIGAANPGRTPDELAVLINPIVALIVWGLRALFLLPTLAVLVRRLHDRDQSGYCAFWLLVPVFGAVLLTLRCASSGTPGPNRFGPAPWRR